MTVATKNGERPGVLRRARGYSTPMLTAIGNTPLVRLSRIVPQGAADVWVKLEYYNPTGSYNNGVYGSEGRSQRT